jgi:hypothetical protein
MDKWQRQWVKEEYGRSHFETEEEYRDRLSSEANTSKLALMCKEFFTQSAEETRERELNEYHLSNWDTWYNNY